MHHIGDQELIVTDGKADFADVYTEPDPRDYYSTLRSLDYQIPEHGRRVFDALLDEIRKAEPAPTVLDVCCSYGINATLLNYDVDLDDLEVHYAAADDLSRKALLAHDRSFLEPRRRPQGLDIVGLDVSAPAVEYAIDAGLLTDGVVADLEQETLAAEDAAKLTDVDLVTVTGGIGYVGERTFEQILDAAEQPPWVAALTLRWIDFDEVASMLESRGLVTERAEDYVVPQRRFVDDGERDFVLRELAERGIDPTGAEADGFHCADLYVARPYEDIEAAPLEKVLEPSS